MQSSVPSCANVGSIGGCDVSVHRYRGFDPSVGVRRGRDAGGAGRARRGVAFGDRGARRVLVQAHRRWRGSGVRVAEVCRRCCGSERNGSLQLPVRMGIATGEAELRDSDYFGAVLNRAARVMAAGHGGQILVADSTAAWSVESTCSNLGPRRLRDVAESGHGCFRCGRRACATTSRRCGRSTRARATCGRATTSFVGRDVGGRRHRRAALRVTSAGHADRCRWRRQDPAGAGGRRAAERRIPGRGMAFRTGGGDRSGRGA